MRRPLDGIKVLELCRVSPCAICGMMLADMGADVLKIEAPNVDANYGDACSPDSENVRAAAAGYCNRSKKSMTLNLKDSEGQRILRALAAKADVLVEGFRPGVMARFGADYASLARLNPRLVYCSLSGYGQDGPYRDYVGHDPNYMALAGMLNLIGEVGGPPVAPLNLVSDLGGAAMHAVIGVMFALFDRERSGQGQFVDISYLDTTFALLAASSAFADYLTYGKVLERGTGATGGQFLWLSIYECKDGKYINVACTEPWLWENFCDVIERPDLKRMAKKPSDMTGQPTEEQNRAKAEVAKVLKTKTRDEWFDLLGKANVCVGKLYELPEVMNDPQLRHRKMITEVEHPIAGTVSQVGFAVKLSKTPGTVSSFAPFLGQHTDEVLEKLGYSAQAIVELRERKVV